MDMHTLPVFLAASVALTMAPGPDNVFVVTQSIARGRRIGIITALGMCSGITVHTAAAALGVSVIFHTSAAAFHGFKCIGAAYLLFLAYKTIREHHVLEYARDSSPSAFAVYRRGFLMNVLNPKVALFFLAFLPQFASEDAGPIAPQTIGLGLFFMAQAVVLFCSIAFLAGSIGDHVLRRASVSKWLSYLSAGVMVSLGIRLALAHK